MRRRVARITGISRTCHGCSRENARPPRYRARREMSIESEELRRAELGSKPIYFRTKQLDRNISPVSALIISLGRNLAIGNCKAHRANGRVEIPTSVCFVTGTSHVSENSTQRTAHIRQPRRNTGESNKIIKLSGSNNHGRLRVADHVPTLSTLLHYRPHQSKHTRLCCIDLSQVKAWREIHSYHSGPPV